MTVFISGGCKNGKSTLAEQVARSLASGGPLYYIATMIPHDGEDRERIARHVASRAGGGFDTIECGRDILSVFDTASPSSTFLLDSVTALLANEMFSADGPDLSAPQRVAAGLESFCCLAGNAVFVSDFIFSDAARYDGLTELYRRGLALADRTLAVSCDAVVEVSFGCHTVHKGALPL